MKPFAVFLPILLCAGLLGCEKYEERVEQVVWRNDTSYDLNIAVYIHDGDVWPITIERGTGFMAYDQTYKSYSLSEREKLCAPAHYLPFQRPNWLCGRGQIDSLVISDAATGLERMRCNKRHPSYNPFLDSNCYLWKSIANGTVFTLSITDKMCALARGECPCDANDTVVTIENERGAIRFQEYYAVWYFAASKFPQKLYMLENLPEQYRQEGLQVSVTGMGKSVYFPESWGNCFTGGCLSDYTIEEGR